MKITISGTPGSGKSTIAKMLAASLKYKHFSSGDFMREMAKERGISLEELGKTAENDNGKIDKEIDERNVVLGLTEDNFVIDGRASYYFIPDSFKIRLTVDLKTGAERIIGDKRDASVEKASGLGDTIAQIKKRMESERRRYKKYYSIDIDDEANYDLVIDTTSLKPEKIVERILEKINK